MCDRAHVIFVTDPRSLLGPCSPVLYLHDQGSPAEIYALLTHYAERYSFINLEPDCAMTRFIGLACAEYDGCTVEHHGLGLYLCSPSPSEAFMTAKTPADAFSALVPEFATSGIDNGLYVISRTKPDAPYPRNGLSPECPFVVRHFAYSNETEAPEEINTDSEYAAIIQTPSFTSTLWKLRKLNALRLSMPVPPQPVLSPSR